MLAIQILLVVILPEVSQDVIHMYKSSVIVSNCNCLRWTPDFPPHPLNLGTELVPA